MHITSFPSQYGIGDLGSQAYAFVDFLAATGQRYWQILPINPTDGINGHSPYSCFSAFAGNPLLISPEMLVIEQFIPASDLRHIPSFDDGSVDYDKVTVFKEKILERAHQHCQQNTDHEDFKAFIKDNAYWIEDYALFVVIKASLKGCCWNEWPKALRLRQPQAITQFAHRHTAALDRVKWVQYLFFRQWHKLKVYAKSQGIAIIGDIPIYVNYDSADVWRHPSLFKVDREGHLKFISGCPPDYFSKTGQRWGNPVYDWGNLKKSGYSWWVNRVAHNLKLFDSLRVDHFRGFASFWQIPAHEKLAVFGKWVKGPGDHFFKVLSHHFKHLPIIAEDLGEISPDVVMMMKKFSFPGMRVLLFGFDGNPHKNPHAPAQYTANCVAYTGTHDNNTIQGWYRTEAKPHERFNVSEVLKLNKIRPSQLHWDMINAVMKSKADTVIVPMPDFLGLREEGRMNTPATKVNNWKWRLKEGQMTKPLQHKILKMIQQAKRVIA